MIRINYIVRKIVKSKKKSTSILKKKLTTRVKNSRFNTIENIKTLKKMDKNVEKKRKRRFKQGNMY